MTEPEDLDEDLFADLYEGDDTTTTSTKPPQQSQGQSSDTTLASQSNSSHTISAVAVNDSSFTRSTQDTAIGSQGADAKQQEEDEYVPGEVEMYGNGQNGDGQDSWEDRTHANDYGDGGGENESHGTGIKEDGKMFIGGLNWETTDQSLKEYFSQFGEVTECTVMRDGASGRSRGFGFLTFKDPRTVNIVMVKEHYLDGKIIDPKRAIPRDEQERTSKIFVGGVSQEATEQDFKEFFMQFGRVLDATLMMDKDTGRPRGFGFVTFDSETAVDATLERPLEIHGKPIEVKKAQPRGNIRDRDDERGDRPFNRHEKRGDRFGDRNDDRRGGSFDSSSQSQNNQQGAQAMYGTGMTPQMMAQYWQRMQQYFAVMQQSLVAQGRGMGAMGVPGMNQGAMNPAMLQQQWQAFQAMGRGQGSQQGSQSPQNAVAMPAMNPAMMQQMQQMQMQQQQQLQEQQAAQAAQAQVQQAQAQAQAQQVQQQQLAAQQQAQQPPIAQGGYGGGGNIGGVPNRLASPASQPGYNAYEQQLFEQQKYEQQQARRAQREQVQYHQQQYQGGPTSWEGMYDDVPQPPLVVPQTGPPAPRGMQQQGGFGRQMSPHQGPGGGGRGGQQGMNRQGQAPQGPQGAPPPNAPTGPKNAGKPGANYRGGGRGAHRGFHPYARNG